MPIPITARGRKRVLFGSSTACFQAYMAAKSRAVQNLWIKAKIKCPNGYSITSGPTFRYIRNCVWHKEKGEWWPRLLTVIQAHATIECDESEPEQEFAYVPEKEELYAAVESWKQLYDELTASYEEIASIKTPEQMESYLKKSGDENALNSFHEALAKGEIVIDDLKPPSMESLLNEPLYGNVLREIAEDEGISAIESFLKDLQDQIKQSDETCKCKDSVPRVSSRGNTVNITINF